MSADKSFERLLRRKEAAEVLGICERKVSELQASGELRCVRIGKAVRFDLRDIEVLVDRLKRDRRQTG